MCLNALTFNIIATVFLTAICIWAGILAPGLVLDMLAQEIGLNLSSPVVGLATLTWMFYWAATWFCSYIEIWGKR